MIKVLQINSTVNTGSHGRIAEGIGRCIISQNSKSYIAYGRQAKKSDSSIFKIGDKYDVAIHGIKSYLFDRHGFGSHKATMRFIKKIERIYPDVIHLHNIHGYYLNIGVLFGAINKMQLPVVWTFHDCWPITGHCSYFDNVDCYRWENECKECLNLRGYPKSIFIDKSKKNYYKKKELFTSVKRMTIVTPSMWLAEHISKSFLQEYPIKVIYNGVDVDEFRPVCINEQEKEKYGIGDNRYIVGVASKWDTRKGLKDFIELRKILNNKIDIVLVGLNKRQIKELPDGIFGVTRTENIKELVSLYSRAEVFLNPTYVDNFPTTNIEALACGTPVITYNTGGSPESINNETGVVVEKGNVEMLQNAVADVMSKDRLVYKEKCRKWAVKKYDSRERYLEYYHLYKSLC